ncbi:MAG: (2Fe-2S)-binding protein [Armatimonadetes bacterium]|nr:(2Fe-2S)-binding protein [Armatimonadota bacterium]MDE2205626.1 (2Fe-2S)-binding protein [Armatimonadota bacterium]
MAERKKKVNQRAAFSRRQFITSVGLAGAGSLGAEALLRHEPGADEPLAGSAAGVTLAQGAHPVTLRVNGKPVTVNVEARTTLISALRDYADPPITGPKLVCDEAACGACTVLVNGKTAYACMLLAVDVVGSEISTVEGFAANGMSPVQEAFVEKDAMMCGFCTPGFVTSITALLRENPNPTEEQVKQACSGNICRCGTYPHVFAAALAAAKPASGK